MALSTGDLCPLHRAEVEQWRGQSCGEAGWGPGHRLPIGIDMARVDSQVALIKGICESGRACSDNVPAPKCFSRDKHRIGNALTAQ